MDAARERFVNVRIVMAGNPDEPFDAAMWLRIAADDHQKGGVLRFAREADGTETMMSIENSWTKAAGALP